MLQAEMNVRMGERHAVHHVANMAQFRRRRLQKFSARRRVKENVPDFDGCADGYRSGMNLFFFSASHSEPVSGRGAWLTRTDRQFSYRTDARQSFSAKSERRNAKQILILFELARGMPLHRERQIFGRHPLAVVGDPN